MLKILLLISITIGLSACSLFQRSPQSGYADTGDSPYKAVYSYYQSKADQEWDRAKSSLGIDQTVELTNNEVQKIKDRIRLLRMEEALLYSQEKKQYYTYKPYLESDRERISFLSIPNWEAREVWAQDRGLAAVDRKFDSVTMAMIESNDISKGMPKSAVVQSWGEPESVEHAGDPVYGNERWRYSKLVSTQDGYQQQTRIVYFESGRVAGWETYP